MAYNSTSDNLLHNIVLNTDNLDRGDFPSLVGMIVASTGANFQIKTQADFIASKAYVFEGSNIPITEIVQFDSVNVTNGKHTSDLDNMIEDLITGAAGRYLTDTEGARAWFRIRKVEVTYSFTGSTVTPTNSVANYKLVAEVYNED
jgi:hypothetical protein